MNRPRTVTVVAVYYFARAALLAVLAVAWRTHMHPLHRVLVQDIPLYADQLVLFLSSYMVAVALFFCVLGVGLLSLWNWTRWIVLITNGLGAARFVLAFVAMLPFAGSDFSRFVSPVAVVMAMIQGVICFWLMQSDVKHAFLEPGVY